MKVFSLNNGDIPTLTTVFSCKPVSDCISVLSYKSVYKSFIKPVHKPPHISSSKLVPVVVHKCSVCKSSPGTRNKFVQVSVNNIICKTSVYLNNIYTDNVWRKSFKVILPSLPVNTISILLVNVITL